MAGETIIFENLTRQLDAQLSPPQARVAALHLPEFKIAIPLPRFRQAVVLGRCDPTTYQYPDIDLTRYFAHKKGVSRQHAAIQRVGEELLVKDMGSVNGTYLNGHRLTSHQLCPLEDGDELSLGTLVLQVQYTLEP